MIPPRKSAAFVWRMEEVLDLHEEPYDPKRPIVCFDERPCQLIGEVTEPLPPKPCEIAKYDSRYKRGGTRHVLMSFEPLTGWREAMVTERRRKQEFADSMRHLAEEVYPHAEKIRVVLDNLSTHTAAAFYESFSAEVARKLARRIEFRYTPVHGSWLNMVEIELSILVRQCLKRRLPDIETLSREVEAWETERNRKGASVDWRFTTEDARTKLKSLYPSTEELQRTSVNSWIVTRKRQFASWDENLVSFPVVLEDRLQQDVEPEHQGCEGDEAQAQVYQYGVAAWDFGVPGGAIQGERDGGQQQGDPACPKGGNHEPQGSRLGPAACRLAKDAGRALWRKSRPVWTDDFAEDAVPGVRGRSSSAR